MTIKHKSFKNPDEALAFLEELAQDKKYIFRGHSNSEFKLVPSLQRIYNAEKRPSNFFKKPHDGSFNQITTLLIEKFKNSLAELGLHFDGSSNLEWLEYARHCGVPTPVLDFTYSPYIALFFAFDSVYAEYKDDAPDPVPKCENHENCECSVIYAVNVDELANIWTSFSHRYTETYTKETVKSNFLNQPDDFKFEDFQLKFIPYPSKHNIRIHRQQGCLLYDTITGSSLQKNLDSLLERHRGEYENSPAAFKIYIPQSYTASIFKKLNLMGITARHLYFSADAVAQDIKNSFNYEI